MTRADSEPQLICACTEIIIKSQDGVQKLRAKVLIIKGDGVFAVCKRCNTEVAVPLQKALSEPAQTGPRLYLSK